MRATQKKNRRGVFNEHQTTLYHGHHSCHHQRTGYFRIKKHIAERALRGLERFDGNAACYLLFRLGYHRFFYKQRVGIRGKDVEFGYTH